VKGEYPFVQLESNRASCAICLLDFQEPRRVSTVSIGLDVPKAIAENDAAEELETRQEGEGDITEQAATPATPATPVTPVTPASPNSDLALRLQDAGQGAQPLRLLKCGHVFHVSPPTSLPALVYTVLTNPLFKRKRVWTRGYSMCLDGVRYASGLSVSRGMGQVQSRALDQSEGGGSEEADGEDTHEHKRV
jgi:hypothetical protein